jgi:hypothetical protein
VLEKRPDPFRLAAMESSAIQHLPLLVNDTRADSLLVEVDADEVHGFFLGWKLTEAKTNNPTACHELKAP